MIVSAQFIQRAGEILKEIEGLQSELAELFCGTNTLGTATAKRRGRPARIGHETRRNVRRRPRPHRCCCQGPLGSRPGRESQGCQEGQLNGLPFF